LVCGGYRIPSASGTSQGPIDPRLAGFQSLLELCSGYPEGMGFYCAADGTMATHPPVWPLYGDFLYVRRFCNFNCWCEDLTDIENMDVAGAPPGAVLESSECSTETDTDGAIVANECAESSGDPLRTDNIGCSSFQYGNPADLDCAGPMGANAMINQYSNEPLQVREFLGISGVAPQHPGYQKVQTPKSFSFGKSMCSLRIGSSNVLAK